MSWPDTYKDRYAASQRALRIIGNLARKGQLTSDVLGDRLAEDPEAGVEFAAAMGELKHLEEHLDSMTANLPADAS